MVSSKLEESPAYQRGHSNARLFVLGTTLAAREEGLAGLELVGSPLEVARKVIGIDDWGPRVVGLQSAATYHAQIGEGALAAAIAVAVRELFEVAAEKAPENIRNIARQAISSVATDFSYGVLRSGPPEAAVTWADNLTPHLLAWGQTDAALTVETLAAEALYTTNRFDAAIARFPKTGPMDSAGRVRYERLKRLIEALAPGGAEPESPSAQFSRALATLPTLLAAIPGTPAYLDIRNAIEQRQDEERRNGLPKTEDDLLRRTVSLEEFVEELRERVSSDV